MRLKTPHPLSIVMLYVAVLDSSPVRVSVTVRGRGRGSGRGSVGLGVRIGLLAIRIDDTEAELILTEYLGRVRIGVRGLALGGSHPNLALAEEGTYLTP